jgi:phage tail tape-measure protein
MSWLSSQLNKSRRKKTGIFSWAGGGKGAAAGAAIGSSIPFVGTAIGGILGAAGDLLASAPKGKNKKSSAKSAWYATMVAQGATMDAAEGFGQLVIISD